MSCRKKVIWLLFATLFVTETYGEEALQDSVVTVLSTMDLNHVKKENDKKIAGLIAELDGINRTNPPHTALKNSSDAGRLPGADSNKHQGKFVTVTAPASEKSVAKKDLPEEDNQVIDFSGVKDLPELQTRLSLLNNKVTVLASKLDTLINLQKLSYDNNLIINEIGAIQTDAKPVTKTGKVSKKEDYFSKFSREKGVKIDPAGFAYNIIKSGTGKITADNIFRLTLTEKKSNGEKISSVSDVMLKYNSTLPLIIYNAVKYIGFGGQIKVVTLAKKIYSTGNYPKDVGANTALVYVLKVGNIN